VANRRKTDAHITVEEVDALFHEPLESLRSSLPPNGPDRDARPGDRGLPMARRPTDPALPSPGKSEDLARWDIAPPFPLADTRVPCPHCRFENDTIDIICGRCDGHLVRWPWSDNDLLRDLLRNGVRIGALLVALGIGLYRWEWVAFLCCAVLFLLFVGTLLRAHDRACREMLIQGTVILTILGLGYYSSELQTLMPITNGQFMLLSLPVVLVVLFARVALAHGASHHQFALAPLSSIGTARHFAFFPVTFGLVTGIVVLRLVDHLYGGTILAPFLALSHVVLVGALVAGVVVGGVISSVSPDLGGTMPGSPSLNGRVTMDQRPKGSLSDVLFEMLLIAHDGIIVTVQLALHNARFVAFPFAFVVLAGISAATFSSSLSAYVWSGDVTFLPTLILAVVGLIASMTGTVASYSGVTPRRVMMTVLRGLPGPGVGAIVIFVVVPFLLHSWAELTPSNPDRVGILIAGTGAIGVAGFIASFVRARRSGGSHGPNKSVAGGSRRRVCFSSRHRVLSLRMASHRGQPGRVRLGGHVSHASRAILRRALERDDFQIGDVPDVRIGSGLDGTGARRLPPDSRADARLDRLELADRPGLAYSSADREGRYCSRYVPDGQAGGHGWENCPCRTWRHTENDRLARVWRRGRVGVHLRDKQVTHRQSRRSDPGTGPVHPRKGLTHSLKTTKFKMTFRPSDYASRCRGLIQARRRDHLWFQDDLHAFFLFVGENVVGFGRVLEPHLMGDDKAGVNVSIPDSLEQRAQIALDVRLAGLNCQRPVHDRSHRELVDESRRRCRSPRQSPPLRQAMIAWRSAIGRSVSRPIACLPRSYA
jgi:hypothetical protein